MSRAAVAASEPSLPPALGAAFALAGRWEGAGGERRMVAGVLRWLLSAGWLGAASQAAFEVPWRGRRIDLVVVGGKGQLSAFEFKLGGTRRVFEQALYNAAATHRSYVVCGSRPGPRYEQLARAQGLGIFVVNGSTELVQRPSARRPAAELSRALRARTRERAMADV